LEINAVKRSTDKTIEQIKKYYIKVSLKWTLQTLLDLLATRTEINNFVLCEVTNYKIASILCIPSIRDLPLYQLNIKNNQCLYMYQCINDPEELLLLYPSKIKKVTKLTARNIRKGDLCEWRDDDLDYKTGRIKDILKSRKHGEQLIYTIEYYDNDKMKKLTRNFLEDEQRVFPYLTFTKEVDVVYHIPLLNCVCPIYYGTPLIISAGSWFTWDDLFEEILLQLRRLIKSKVYNDK
jgi:hypothetical protein